MSAHLTPSQIVAAAIEQYKPVAIYAGFSGGNGSRPLTHWAMNNVPGCEVVHFNTGIGIEAGRQWVRDTCKSYGWRLHEIHAPKDSYRNLVLKYGFPGPDGHRLMYQRLKERAVYELCRRAKVGHKRSAKVMLITGIRHADSIVRTGYAGREVNKVRAQIWVNPIYWWANEERDAYDAASGMPRNPIADALGMSGECGCGAYAQRGELERWGKVDPSFPVTIRRLEAECLARGFTWGWEGRPPAGGFNKDQLGLFKLPLCVGCEKSAIVQAEMEAMTPHDPAATQTACTDEPESRGRAL